VSVAVGGGAKDAMGLTLLNSFSSDARASSASRSSSAFSGLVVMAHQIGRLCLPVDRDLIVGKMIVDEIANDVAATDYAGIVISPTVRPWVTWRRHNGYFNALTTPRKNELTGALV